MQNKRWLANALIGAGAILILVVIGYFGWSQVSAARLRAELRSAPAALPPAATSTPPLAAATATTRPAVGATAVSQRAVDTTVPTAVPTAVPTDAPTAVITALPTAGRTEQPASLAAAAAPAATATKAPTVARAATQPAAAATKPPATAQPARPAATAVTARVEPARLTIPDLKIDAKIVPMTWQVVNTAQGPVSEWVIPKDDGGHHINSAYLGEPGNLVISGHNNIYARVFLNISQAWDDATRVKADNYTDRSEILTGRRLTLYDAAGNAHEYAITDFYRVRDTGVSYEQRVKNGRFMLPTETEQVTIITCWPPTNNTHRLVVIAKPVR